MKKINALLLPLLLFCSLSANEKALIEGLSYMACSPRDISTERDAFIKDSFSMKLCDYLLEKPERSEFETEILVEKIRKLSFGRAFSYCDNLKNGKKKNGKADWSFLRKKRDFTEIGFLTDTLITDSIYYAKAEKYLASLSFVSEEDLKKMLDAADYMLSLDSAGILKLAEALRSEYGADFEIIIGGAGNDTYLLEKGNRIIVDLFGDDAYLSKGGYSIACGNNGLSAIIDLSGNDSYVGESFDIGCGINGVGFVDDRGGNDSYSSQYCSIGAGFGGLGFVLDRGGNDAYSSCGFSQGFGFTKGAGIIYDASGDDSYTSAGGMNDPREDGYHSHLSQGFGYGIRDIASGGAGILLDDSGDDMYFGEYFVQGSSYWHSLGILYDSKGNDLFKSRRYSQGAGTHFTVGLLFDREGNDLYHSWGVSQGCGHDFSFGMLSDYSGNDAYFSNWLSQGAGNANGTGVLLDFSGDDAYRTEKTDCQGWANPDRGTFSYGMLFDMSGEDVFNGSFIKSAVKTRMGVLIDKN